MGEENGATLCMMRNLEIERVTLAAMGLGIARCGPASSSGHEPFRFVQQEHGARVRTIPHVRTPRKRRVLTVAGTHFPQSTMLPLPESPLLELQCRAEAWGEVPEAPTPPLARLRPASAIGSSSTHQQILALVRSLGARAPTGLERDGGGVGTRRECPGTLRAVEGSSGMVPSRPVSLWAFRDPRAVPRSPLRDGDERQARGRGPIAREALRVRETRRARPRSLRARVRRTAAACMLAPTRATRAGVASKQ